MRGTSIEVTVVGLRGKGFEKGNLRHCQLMNWVTRCTTRSTVPFTKTECRINQRFRGTRCSFRHTESEALGEHSVEMANRALGSLGLEFRKEVSVERNLGVNHFYMRWLKTWECVTLSRECGVSFVRSFIHSTDQLLKGRNIAVFCLLLNSLAYTISAP